MEKRDGWLSSNLLLLWQGQAVSQVGSQLFIVTVVLWLKEATGSAAVIGTLMMAGAIPGVLLSPFGGVLADRFSRRRILIVGDLLRGLALLVVGLGVMLPGRSVGMTVTALMAVAVLSGVISAAWQPAVASLLPELVPRERLSSANSMLQASLQICGLAAQAVAGLLFGWLGAPLTAALDGASYLYAAASTALARVPAGSAPLAARPAAASVRVEMLRGLEYVRGHAGMRSLFSTVALLQVFLAPILLLFPFYVDRQLIVGPEWYGFLLAALGLGTLVGQIAAAVVRVGGAASAGLVLAAMGLLSVSLAALAVAESAWAAMAIVGTIGLASGFLNVKLLTALQLATPPDIRGRVFGVLGTITGALAPIAMGLTGLLTDITGRHISLVYGVCGIAAALLSASIALRRECRAFLAGDAEVPAAALERPTRADSGPALAEPSR